MSQTNHQSHPHRLPPAGWLTSLANIPRRHGAIRGLLAATLGIAATGVTTDILAAPFVPYAGCGQANGNRYYYGACNVIINKTRGWTQPGVLDRTGGFTLFGNRTQSVWGNSRGSLANVFLLPQRSFAASGSILPNAWGGARCRSNQDDGASGCENYNWFGFQTTQNSPGTPVMQNELIRQAPGQMQTRQVATVRTRANATACDATPLRYVTCSQVRTNNHGNSQQNPVWEYALTNQPVAIRLTNQVNQRLVLASSAWGSMVNDPRATTRETTRSNGQTNSGLSLAPKAGGIAGEAQYGTFRPVAEITEATLIYDYVDTTIDGVPRNSYTGNRVFVYLRLGADGRDAGSSCKVSAASFPQAFCATPTITRSDGKTVINLVIRPSA
ncbi:MAG: hypothetical protein RLZZ09_1350 [Pseudomonadota bacterium]|jgi:hypothetical protein